MDPENTQHRRCLLARMTFEDDLPLAEAAAEAGAAEAEGRKAHAGRGACKFVDSSPKVPPLPRSWGRVPLNARWPEAISRGKGGFGMIGFIQRLTNQVTSVRVGLGPVPSCARAASVARGRGNPPRDLPPPPSKDWMALKSHDDAIGRLGRLHRRLPPPAAAPVAAASICRVAVQQASRPVENGGTGPSAQPTAFHSHSLPWQPLAPSLPLLPVQPPSLQALHQPSGP